MHNNLHAKIMNYNLPELREVLSRHNIDAFIIPSSDPHQSEYVADHWKVREWISGFTGSAGTAVVTQNHAGLWTDSRYFIQAEAELDQSALTLHKVLKSEDSYLEWLKDNIPQGATIGMDGRLISMSQLRSIKKTCQEKEFQYVTQYDLISDIWQDRPQLPAHKVFEYDIKYACTTRRDKISLIRDKLKQHKAQWVLLPTLDDIAWLFNLRGRDVDYNPVFYAFALIGREDLYLFVDELKIPKEVKNALAKDKIIIEPYHRAYDVFSIIGSDEVLLDPDDCSVTLLNQFRNDQIMEAKCPSRILKAQKTVSEISHIENAMIKDGIALTHAFKWVEDSVQAHVPITELDVAMKIASCRSQQEGYFGESFPAIVGYQENGAIVHYRPPQEGGKTIKAEGMLLCDSGGQYLDGTTDITRTISLGVPTSDQMHNYTCVLKGHIALDQIIFPEGTSGAQMDILARQFLWQKGLNYGHGTGHGVGYFLNVHEPPQGYSPARNTVPLIEGMLSSNEPGYYENGAYGIRIENLILVEKSSYEGFLKHRTMSLFPIDTRLIDHNMLTLDESNWINEYHAAVFSKLSPHLDDANKAWLRIKCEKI